MGLGGVLMVNEQEHGHPSPRHLALPQEERALPRGNLYCNCLFGPLISFYYGFSLLAIDVVGYIFPGDSCMPVRLLALLNVW